MLNGVFILSLCLLSAGAIFFACWPIRQTRLVWILGLFIGCLAGLAYWHWGAWQAQSVFMLQTAKQKEAEKLLKTLKSPTVLMQKLQDHLQKHPRSARGWYLLGRLYASQRQWEKAYTAFEKAFQINPQDELIAVNYAHSLFNKHTTADDETARTILKNTLATHPQQPDALMLLALDAERRQDKAAALKYWRTLLLLLPDTSPEAESIRKKIQALNPQ